MKLGIFCNYGPPHIGGSEFVISNVSKHLIEQYNYKTTIYSYMKNQLYLSGPEYCTRPCLKGDQLIAQINENDHIFVYSDSFWGWDTVVQNIDKIVPDVSVALVGAYNMRSHPEIAKQFLRNKSRYRVITHAEGFDYDWAIKNGLRVSVVPNGVDLAEFRENKVDFRKDYHIKEKHVILNVSNFFYGKGQMYLPEICKLVSTEIEDCILVQISSTIDYSYGKIFRGRCIKKCDSMRVKSLFLQDIPRKDLISAFLHSDVFLFPSQKEIASLVILECRAAKLPYVSMEVGNIREQSGGIVLPIIELDKKGYAVIKDNDIRHFYCGACHLLNQHGKKRMRGRVIEEGQKGIEGLDWKNIVPLYDKVFQL